MPLVNAITEKTFLPLAANACDVSDRLAIREFSIEDLSYLQEIDMDVFFVHLRQTFGGPMGFLNAAMAHQKQKDRKDFYLAIVDKGSPKVIGSVMIYNYDKEKRQAEIGYFIDKHNQNRKFATEACVYAMQHFGEVLGLKSFYATVHPQNVYSKKLLTRLGFVQKGDVFVSQYKGDPDRSDSYDEAGHLINAPRIGLFVSYEDFLSQKSAILSKYDNA